MNSSRQKSRIPPNPWSLREFGVILLWSVFFYSQVFLFLSIASKYHLLWSDAGHGIAVIFSGGGVYLFFLALLRPLLRQKGLTFDSAFGFENGSPVQMFYGAVMGLAAASIPISLVEGMTERVYRHFHQSAQSQPIFELLHRLLIPNPSGRGFGRGFWPWLNHLPNAWVLGGLISLAVVLAPMAEEVLFRGMLYPFFKERVGASRGIFTTSLLFAVMHFHLPSFLPLFILAITLNLLYEWRGNLLACIFCHALFNGSSLYYWFMTGH